MVKVTFLRLQFDETFSRAWCDDMLTRDYIPAIDTFGKPCMYDAVTKQPFYNLGKGDFGYETTNGNYVAPI